MTSVRCGSVHSRSIEKHCTSNSAADRTMLLDMALAINNDCIQPHIANGQGQAIECGGQYSNLINCINCWMLCLYGVNMEFICLYGVTWSKQYYAMHLTSVH